MSRTQFPLQDVDLQMFQKGFEKGRDLAIIATRRLAAWAEENPGRLVLVGLAAGFVLGKLFFRRRVAPISE